MYSITWISLVCYSSYISRVFFIYFILFYILVYIWSIALCGAETWTLRAVDQKQQESFEVWCWRRMEKVGWTDHVRIEEVLLRVKERRNILYEISKRKANCIETALYNGLLKER